jgi:hypothetical protein
MDKMQEQARARLGGPSTPLEGGAWAMDAAQGILRGIGFAIWGVASALRNPRLMSDYTRFAKSMGVVLLALYSAAIVLLFFALPIVVFVPGLALQLLALIPYWAISITKSRSPVSTNVLFFVRSPTTPLTSSLIRSLTRTRNRTHRTRTRTHHRTRTRRTSCVR